MTNMPPPEFPHIHNFGASHIEGSTITFTYFNSHGQVITETLHIMSPKEVADRTRKRHARFMSMPPGTRESEESRRERKWISAHRLSVLRPAWAMMDSETKMEFVMMLDMNSHMGISDPEWASEHRSVEVVEVKGDDGEAI